MTHDEYLRHDASGLADRVRAGEVRPSELLELALERTEALNPELNAVVRLMEDHALERVRTLQERPGGAGPFAGVPFLAKDLLMEFEGHPTSAGSRYLAGTPAPFDSETARRIQGAGFVVYGKTNLPEAGLTPYSESEYWGVCRNPWDPERTPGGSSGGSAAAVAAGLVPVAGGGDGGGSIRIPASCCGLFGLKPTRGRVPTGPYEGLIWRGLVTEHVLTRSVRDSATVLDVLAGPDPGAPVEIAPPERPYRDEVGRDPGRLRVGFTAEPFLPSEVHPGCVAAVEAAAELLEEMGHEVVRARLPVDGPAFARAFLTLVAGELAADLEDARIRVGRPPRPDELEATTRGLALLGEALGADEYAAAVRTLERVGRSTAPFFLEHDLLLTPTLAAPPARHGELSASRWERRLLSLLGSLGSGSLLRLSGLLDRAADDAFDFIPWTPVANATGRPAMSVPLHEHEGLPVGVHLVARFGREDVLVRLAARLEEARPWFDCLPEMAHRPGRG